MCVVFDHKIFKHMNDVAPIWAQTGVDQSPGVCYKYQSRRLRVAKQSSVSAINYIRLRYGLERRTVYAITIGIFPELRSIEGNK